MGCDSAETNFNNYIFHDGTWQVCRGWDRSYSAKDIGIIITELRRNKKNPRKDYTFRYNWQHNVWVATPINHS